MNYSTLRAEILIGPLAATLAQYVVDQNAPAQNAYLKDKAIADVLNAENGTRIVEDFVNAIELMSRLGAVAAATILDKLETASGSHPVLKWALVAINSETGINIGDPQTVAVIDALAADTVLTSEEAAAIKALAERPSSRAYAVFGSPVTAADVSIALRGNASFIPGE